MTPETKECEECGKSFTRPDDNPRLASNWNRRRFCSERCRNDAKYRRRKTGTSRIVRRGTQPAAEFIQDIELLIDTDNPLNIEKRMGRPLVEMRARLRRLHREDLAIRLLLEQRRYNFEAHNFDSPAA